MHRIAILDLGTNTFNLLIAENALEPPFQPNFIYSHELPVELGKGGPFRSNKDDGGKEITPEAMHRAIRALHQHFKKMGEFGIGEYYAFATSAVRDAANGKQFIRKMRIETGIEIKILSGDDEAGWIYEGVKQANVLGKEPALIMDIGGGSTEFIIASETQLFWKKSYPLGVSRLYEIFSQMEPFLQPADPITLKLRQVEEHISTMLKDLFETVKVFKPVVLIGSSGSFDSFAEMIIYRTGVMNKGKGVNESGGNHTLAQAGNGYVYPLIEFNKLYSELIKSTLEERLAMPGLIQMRAPMFSYSVVLTDITLKNTLIKRMVLSRYAMKEGIAAHLLGIRDRE